MAKYRANDRVYVAHLGRFVNAGDEFEAEFPKGFKPGANLTELDKTPRKSRKTEPEPETDSNTSTDSQDAVAETTDDENDDGTSVPELADG